MTPGVVAESDLSGTLKSEYVFFDGERVARRDGATGTGGVFYYFSDHLKTASVITDSAGVIKAESDYYPWGGELQFVNNDSNDYKFTGKKRDLETGLDYFGARYYSNGLGRWVSADWSATPVPVPYADFGDPQSLNGYTYVRNIPTTNIDTDGHQQVSDKIKVDMEYVRRVLNSLKPLTPVAAPAVATVPAILPVVVLGAPSAGAMTAVVVLPPVQNHPDTNSPSAGEMMLDALSPGYQPPPPVQGNDQNQQNQQQQNQGKTDEEKKKEEPQTETATGGSGKAGKGTKDRGKDYSQQGTVDQLKSIQQDQRIKNIQSTKKSEQNVDNANKKIKSSEDVGHED
jgi:RHS repeat-associated protein